MFSREEFIAFVQSEYGAAAEYPWARTPQYGVFRHGHNRKWFAALMALPKKTVGLEGDEIIDALNVKCDPLLNGSFRTQAGVLPAYHMNKEHWLTVVLQMADEALVKELLALSYELTR